MFILVVQKEKIKESLWIQIGLMSLDRCYFVYYKENNERKYYYRLCIL